MNSQVKRILKWAVIGAVVAFATNLFVTTDQSTGVRICFGLLVAGAGAVTGALLCANFTADEEEPAEGHTPGHEQHH